MTAFALLFIFILGSLIGSFLNVLVLRHNTGRSIVTSSSMCFSCGKRLRWYELIPFLSFIWQKGRCRKCKSKISWQYPVVEFAAGLLFVAVAFKVLGLIPDTLYSISHTPYLILGTAYYLFVFSLLLAISVYDIRHKIIPNAFVYTFNALAFLVVLNFGNWSLFENWSLGVGYVSFLPSYLLTGFAFFALFALLWFFSKGKWMGFGDAKLALGIGWLLGPSVGIAALMLSFWIGAVYGLSLIAYSRVAHLFSKRQRGTIRMKSEIPFGPFLALGAFLAFLFSIHFIDLQNLFLFY